MGAPRLATCFGITGVLVLALGFAFRFLIMPAAVHRLAHDLGDSNLVIPNDTSSPRYKAFQGSAGQPPRYWKFYLYNLSNPDEVVDGGRPSVKLHGPYTYMETMDRHDVEFSKDLKTVSFEEFQQFHFVPAMSYGSESDTFITPNVVYGAAVKSCLRLGFWGKDHPPCILPNQYCVSDMANTCFFLNANVTQHLWSRMETLIHDVAGNWADTNFQFFFNCSSPDTCRHLYRDNHFFGMGGECSHVQETGIADMTICRSPGMANRTARSTMLTGRDDHGQSAGQYVEYLGNSTISFNYTGPKATFLPVDSGAMDVRGSDGSTFSSLLDEDSELWVFEPDAMRSIPLAYKEPRNIHGLPAMRFVARADAFDHGGINLTNLATIRYGQPAPVIATRLLFDRVDDPRAKVAHCTNCHEVLDGPLEPFVDVEPLTGVTLRGQLRVQMNIHVGQSELYGSPNMSCFANGECPHAKVQDHFCPYFIVEKVAMMNSSQAHSLLHDVYTFHAVERYVFFGLLGVGAIFCLLGVYFFARAKRRASATEQIRLLDHAANEEHGHNPYGTA